MSSERFSKAAPDLPDLDQLAALVQSDAGAPSPEQLADAPGRAGEAGAQAAADDDVDDAAPTDYYHAVKPKPKAVPLADVGTDDQVQVEEEPPRRRVWVGLVAAALLTGMLGLVGLLHHQQQGVPESAASQPAGEPGELSDGVVDQVHPARRTARDRSDTELPEPEPDPAAEPAAPGAPIRIRFERRGQAILVPVQVGGALWGRPATMVLDTGATFSTFTEQTLAALGVRPTRVEARVETANGVVTRPLAVVDSIALAGAAVGDGLTVGVCNACAPAGTAGLLGLNFARHFVLTVDHDAGELQLAPKRLGEKTMDIRPFVSLLDAQSERKGDVVVIRFSIHNKAPRPLAKVVIEATSPGLPSRLRTTIAQVAAGGQQAATIEGALSGGGGARTFTLEVVRASW